MKSFLRDTLTTLLLAIVIYVGLRTTLKHSVVISPSMEPTLMVGQHVLVSSLAYKFREPQRGDIVVFHPVSSQGSDFIKRIIGLPGESVEIRGGIVYIHEVDGQVSALKEPYLKEAAANNFKGKTIPPKEYFVMGDNRNNSGDSRDGWTVPRQNITGKAWLDIGPSKWGLAPNYPLQKQIDGLTSQSFPMGRMILAEGSRVNE
ncbi:MAG: lepB [Dehalococcoidales bacterium]|nr:lepB [Dehalococcoidales bacterium]